MFAKFWSKRLEMSKSLKSFCLYLKSCQLAAMRWRLQVHISLDSILNLFTLRYPYVNLIPDP